MAVVKSDRKAKVVTEGAVAKAKVVRRPRGTVGFGESSLNATRAWEAAQARGATGTLEDFHVAYNKTSRRRKAKLNDPAFLRARLAALEGNGSPTDVPQVTQYALPLND